MIKYANIKVCHLDLWKMGLGDGQCFGSRHAGSVDTGHWTLGETSEPRALAQPLSGFF